MNLELARKLISVSQFKGEVDADAKVKRGREPVPARSSTSTRNMKQMLIDVIIREVVDLVEMCSLSVVESLLTLYITSSSNPFHHWFRELGLCDPANKVIIPPLKNQVDEVIFDERTKTLLLDHYLLSLLRHCSYSCVVS